MTHATAAKHSKTLFIVYGRIVNSNCKYYILTLPTNYITGGLNFKN